MEHDDRRLVLGALMPGLRDSEVEPWLARAMADGVETVCLFGDAVGSPDRVRRSAAALRSFSPEVLVCLDEESGDVTRVQAVDGSSFLSPLALGAIDDPSVTRASARLLGRLLRAVGIDWTLAPVADVNVDPRNPVIGVRSFGTDPDRVAAQTAEMVRGLQSEGVAACAKHFPGHGDTHVDSHESLPTLDASLEVLESRELVPFRAAVAADVASVMTGHLLVPAMDAESPASLSESVTTDWLRQRLAFTGTIVTDAVEMGAVAGPDRQDIGAAAVAALRAGADVVCIGADDQEHALAVCLEAGMAAVADGRLDRTRLREAAERRARLRLGAGGTAPDADEADDEGTVARAAARSLTVVGDPVLRTDAVHVLRISAHPGYAAGQTGWGVAGPLAALGLDVRTSSGDGRLPEDGARALVIEVRDVWKEPMLQARLDEVLAARPDAVVVDFGWPQSPDARATGWISTRGTGRLSSELAACALAARDPEPVALAVLRTARQEIS